MIIAANVFTTQMKNLVQRWKLEGAVREGASRCTPTSGLSGEVSVPGKELIRSILAQDENRPDAPPLQWRKEGYKLPSTNCDLEPSYVGNTPFGGLMVLYDWDRREILWRSRWGNVVLNPAGYCFANECLYVNDLEGAHIFEIDCANHLGQPLRRISHPYFNDLHSLIRTHRGFMVTCTGLDLILEVDLNGGSLYEWWAVEHGFETTISGLARSSGRGQEHRDMCYHTRYHTTHVNDAKFRDDKEQYLLALLFHQGQLVQINRDLPSDQQRAEVLLEGLNHPHALQRTSTGWMLCSSSTGQIIFLDREMRECSRFGYVGGWLQDCRMLSNGNILLNDVDNHKLIELQPPNWSQIHTLQYDGDWRMGELCEVPEPYADKLPNALSNSSPLYGVTF